MGLWNSPSEWAQDNVAGKFFLVQRVSMLWLNRHDHLPYSFHLGLNAEVKTQKKMRSYLWRKRKWILERDKTLWTDTSLICSGTVVFTMELGILHLCQLMALSKIPSTGISSFHKWGDRSPEEDKPPAQSHWSWKWYSQIMKSNAFSREMFLINHGFPVHC